MKAWWLDRRWNLLLGGAIGLVIMVLLGLAALTTQLVPGAGPPVTLAVHEGGAAVVTLIGPVDAPISLDDITWSIDVDPERRMQGGSWDIATFACPTAQGTRVMAPGATLPCRAMTRGRLVAGESLVALLRPGGAGGVYVPEWTAEVERDGARARQAVGSPTYVHVVPTSQAAGLGR